MVKDKCNKCKGKLELLINNEDDGYNEDDECIIICDECGLLHWNGTKKDLENILGN